MFLLLRAWGLQRKISGALGPCEAIGNLVEAERPLGGGAKRQCAEPVWGAIQGIRVWKEMQTFVAKVPVMGKDFGGSWRRRV